MFLISNRRARTRILEPHSMSILIELKRSTKLLRSKKSSLLEKVNKSLVTVPIKCLYLCFAYAFEVHALCIVARTTVRVPLRPDCSSLSFCTTLPFLVTSTALVTRGELCALSRLLLLFSTWKRIDVFWLLHILTHTDKRACVLFSSLSLSIGCLVRIVLVVSPRSVIRIETGWLLESSCTIAYKGRRVNIVGTVRIQQLFFSIICSRCVLFHIVLFSHLFFRHMWKENGFQTGESYSIRIHRSSIRKSH